MLLKEEREHVVEYGKQLLERNLSVGTFGNISIYNEKENHVYGQKRRGENHSDAGSVR